MLSIGEFSKINRITPKTLRHYEKFGLIKPIKIDDWTGYRYYSIDQLPLIRKILNLKDMGFSLIEIGQIIEQPEILPKLLKQCEQHLSKEISLQRKKMDRVKEYLVQVEGDQRMNYQVEIKSLPRVTVASMRTRVENYDRFFDIVPKMGEYMKSVGAVCREPFYCFTVYHDGEYKEEDIDVEICEAVIAPCENSNMVLFKVVEEVEEAACLLHKGPYSSLRDSYNQLFSWIHNQGREIGAPPRESYIDGIWNKEDDSQWLTEIQVPLNKEM